MARLKPNAQALQMLKAGLCPECGAQVVQGLAVCRGCKIEFGEHSQLAPAAGAPAPAAARAAPAAAAPAPQAITEPASPAAAPRAAPVVVAQGAPGVFDTDELERGLVARTKLPLTAAGLFDVTDGAPLALGSALLAAAHALMADAAIPDLVEVLLTKTAPPTHIPRAVAHAKKSSAADVDDAVALLASAPVARAPVAAAPPVAAPAVAAPPPAPPVSAPVFPAAQAAPPAPHDAATGVDPDATLVHNADDIARIAAEIAAREEREAAAAVSARGGVRPLE